MRISYWSSDVCSSDLRKRNRRCGGKLCSKRQKRPVGGFRWHRHTWRERISDRQLPVAGNESASGWLWGRCKGARTFCHGNRPGYSQGNRAGHAYSLSLRTMEAAGFPCQDCARQEERRVGKECVSTCRSGWSPNHQKKKTKK